MGREVDVINFALDGKIDGLKNNLIGIMSDNAEEIGEYQKQIDARGFEPVIVDPGLENDQIQSLLEERQLSLLLSRNDYLSDKSIPDLMLSKRVDLKPEVTVKRPQILDLDSLPIPDRSLINNSFYLDRIGHGMTKNKISLMTSRGCPFKCIYCHKLWPKNNVIRSAENMFEEVKLYYGFGVRNFVILDDIFNLNVKVSTNFFKLILKHKLDINIQFPNGLRGDILAFDYIDLMIEAGTIEINFALETGSERLQKLIRKNLKLEKLHRNVQYITEKYPHVVLEFNSMVGFPTETEEEAMMTLDFIKSIKWIDFPYIHILKIYPNTEMEHLALENGISKETILKSQHKGYQELSDTLQLSHDFIKKYRTKFFIEYFLRKERLRHVIPRQLRAFTEDELNEKYTTYQSRDLNSLIRFAGIDKDQYTNGKDYKKNIQQLEVIDKKIKAHFPTKKYKKDAMKVLLMDLSTYTSKEAETVKDSYKVVEAPLGLMYLQTYVNKKLPGQVEGKIIKAGVDFDNFADLRKILQEFQPDMVGIRTLSYYRNYLHKVVLLIRQWDFKMPIVLGGPYATSNYESILKDTNIDLVVIGEGELTYLELLEKMIQNNKKLPDDEVLKTIPGIAYFKKQDKKIIQSYSRNLILSEEIYTTI
ncbi:MAG: radical SAM protein [Desulfobacteraceae bacterium]|nr:radical SAM protein [Desulfobacteraceae bacterium]